MTGDDLVVELLARTAGAAGDVVTPPSVDRLKAAAARRIARARARAVGLAAAAILLVGAGAALVPLTDTTTPAPAPDAIVAPAVADDAPPPPALLAETATDRWKARTAGELTERSPRRDKI